LETLKKYTSKEPDFWVSKAAGLFDKHTETDGTDRW